MTIGSYRLEDVLEDIEKVAEQQRKVRRSLGRNLAKLLRPEREKRKVSLRGLAKILKITPSYLSDIENDRRLPSGEVAKRIKEWAEGTG